MFDNKTKMRTKDEYFSFTNGQLSAYSNNCKQINGINYKGQRFYFKNGVVTDYSKNATSRVKIEGDAEILYRTDKNGILRKVENPKAELSF